MSSVEGLLGALVRPKIEEIQGRLEFWKEGIDLPEGETWQKAGNLTLEKFLELHPCPTDPADITMYGVAWEFIWGEKPPKVVTKAREEVISKAESGRELTGLEKIWIKLIEVDTDYF